MSEDKSNERIQSLILLSKNVDDHRSGILLSKATIRAETSPASLSQVIRVAAFLPTVYCRKQLGIVKLFRNNGIFIVSNDDKLRLQKGNDSWDLIEIHLDQNSLAQKETLTVISMNNKSDGGRGKHDLEWIFHNTSLKIQTERSLQKAATTQPAVDSTNFEVFKHILSHKFIIQYSLVLPQEIGSLLTVASNRGQEILVQLALDYGANVDFISSKGRTALHWATRNGALPPVKILLKNGADVNKKDGKGWTPLHFAANQGHLEIVRTLLLNGAEINPTGSDDRTPLHWAAGNGLVAVVNLLLDEGANVNAEDEDGYTPLHFATKQEHLDVMELLVLNGADVNSKAKDRGYTPLHLLAYHWICPQNAVVQLLIERGAAVDTKDNNGNTPLQVAVANTNVLWTSVVQLLIDGGADVSSKDRLFRTPLQNAGSFEMMKVLLENGADPNESDSSQLRALLEEIDYEGPSRIQVWLDHGACVERKFDGKSVLAWAYLCGRSSTKAFEYVLERCFINPFSLIGTEIHETLFHPTFDLHHYAGMDGANHRSVVCSQPYIRHLVKIMSLNLYEFIDIDIESIWHWRGETFSDFKEKCEAEVNKMKGQLIAGAYLSVFDVLAKSENEISCLLRNQSVVSVINLLCIKESFPIYGNILTHHIEKGRNRCSFQKRGICWFSRLSDHFKSLPFEIKDNITSYLSVIDILNLRRVCTHSMAAKRRNSSSRTCPFSSCIMAHYVQGLIFLQRRKKFFVDEHMLYNPGTSTVEASAYAFLPTGFTTDHPGMLRFFQERQIHVLNDENVSILLPEVHSLRSIEILLVQRNPFSLPQLCVYRCLDSKNTIASLLNIPISTVGNRQVKCIHPVIDDYNLKLLERLFSCRTDIPCNFGPYRNGYLLHMAAKTGQLALVSSLLNHGAEVNCKDEFHKYTAVHHAVFGGFASIVQLLADKGADLNAKDLNGCSPLHYVNHFDVAKTLLENGADVNSMDGDAVTPLSRIITVAESNLTSDRSNFVKLFLTYGSRLEDRDKSVLRTAYKAQRPETFLYLLESCFTDPALLKGTSVHTDVSRVCFSMVSKDLSAMHKMLPHHVVKIITLHQSPLFDNVINSLWTGMTSLAKFKSLCEAEVESLKNRMCSDPQLSLFDILLTNERKVSRLMENDLVAKVINIKDKELDEKFPIYGNIIRYHLEKAKNIRSFLKQGSINFDALSSQYVRLPYELREMILTQFSPVDFMILNRTVRSKWKLKTMSSHPLFQCLIFTINNQSPATSNSASSASSGNVAYALLPDNFLREHTNILRLFERKNIAILNGESVLALLSKVNELLVLEILLDGSPSATLDPLYVATSASCHSDVQRLLGVNPEQIKEGEYDKIHSALDDENLKVIEQISSRRPDIPCKFNNIHGNLLHMAARTGHLALVILLLDNGADIQCKNNALGCTPLHQAVSSGSERIVKLFIDRGANVNLKDSELRTPLHYARHLDSAKILLESGADVNALDRDGKSPLLRYLQDPAGDSVFELHQAGLQLFLKYGAQVEGKYERNPILKLILERSYVPVFQYFLECCFVDSSIFQDKALHDATCGIPEDLIKECPHYFHELGRTWDNINWVFSRHLVKVATLLQIPDSENVVESIWRGGKRRLVKFRKVCEKEVIRLISFQIAETGVSLFDILTSKEKKIARLLENESIAVGLSSLEFSEQFPEFGNIMKYHLEKGKNWKVFQEEGFKSFKILSCHFKALPDEIKEKIINFLSPTDIMNLKRTVVILAKA
ncbi:uncharacterized protein [Bemisia tabaci]|uniref:uncharacterized protein n=1 Tax=Bemisia tabaci TaxID=7038 RepID=UPI003B280465